MLEKFKNFGIGWAEIIALLTAFLLVTGISYFYAYYGFCLNAEWVINLLTTKELLTSNIKLGACVIMASMYLLPSFLENSKTKPYKELILGCTFFILLLIFAVSKGDVWYEILAYIITLISIFYFIYGPAVVKVFSVVLILFVVPFINGIHAYTKHIKQPLPEVYIKDDPKKWLLFDTFSNQAVLIDDIKKEKNIRVVPVNDLKNISVK